MKFINTQTIRVFILALLVSVILTRCADPETDDDFTPGDPPPIGSWANSEEVSAENLVAHWGFEGNVSDSKGAVTGGAMNGNGTFTAGRKGQAYQGSSNAFISYTSPGPLAGLTSFTVSFWINTAKHDGGAQGIFALGKADGSFWGNFFVIVEGNTSTSDRMQLKLHFEKNTVPPVSNVEHWIDPPADKRPDNMYGAWRHVSYTYDATSSKAAFYANGQVIDIGADADRKANSTTPLGPLAFVSATKFIIGGFQNHLGMPFNGLEPWMLNFTGKLDELRIYNKALSSQEISAIYQLERQGR